ncbi:MAG: TlpA family protein disulfide reductase [Chlorobiaceae bacterium]|nr:TlpA family protein disulfide reductase [Chlorobiaceae bacterium]NTW10139.1 TlpA family protein disulfide reductase [Chlorobiaceae bacterium]
MKMNNGFMKAAVAAFMLLSCGSRPLSAAPALQVYPSAPAFSAVSLNGRQAGSSTLAGKAYIINFFASWCPPCRGEIPDMVSLQNQYAAKGFTFIGVAVSDREPAIREFARQYRISYPVVMGNDAIVNAFNRYVEGGIQAIPTSFVVNSSGKITKVITGARSREDFEKMILQAIGTQGKTKSSL